MQFSLKRLSAIGLATHLLAGCATAPQPAPSTTAIELPAPSAIAKTAAAATETAPIANASAASNSSDEFVTPELKNHTPFPTLMMTATDQWGEYFSAGIKLSFKFDATGQMLIDSANSEDTLDENDDAKNDNNCSAKGGGLNQRTAWFPDTGIFVRGGKLTALKNAKTETMPLLPLRVVDYGLMQLAGEKSRAIEMAYVPCVGRYKVAAGHRTVGFLSAGATLDIQPQSGKKISLKIPALPQPFVMLRFREGAIIPAPMRIVMFTVDMQEKRVVMQFQSTIPLKPALRKLEWMALMPDDQPDPSETKERSLERAGAIAGDLAACPLPLRPMEPCASPRRSPDPRIYFASKKQ
jgi:hypothetical protein